MQKTHGCRNHGIYSWMFTRHSLLSSWPSVAKKFIKSYCKFCTNRFYPLGSGVNKILTEICCALYTVQTSVLHILCNQNEIWCSIFANAKCSSLPLLPLMYVAHVYISGDHSWCCWQHLSSLPVSASTAQDLPTITTPFLLFPGLKRYKSIPALHDEYGF